MILTWPYKGRIKIEIINWKNDKAHETVYVDFTHTNTVDCVKRPEGENSNIGFGTPEAISRSDLYDIGPQYQYVYNDVMHFKVVQIYD